MFRAKNGNELAIRALAGLVVGMVGGIAGYISYGHAYELGLLYGETRRNAWALPLTIDGLIIAASLVILRAAWRGHRADPMAYVFLVAGIGATLFANIHHGWAHGPVGWFVAGWPAVAFLGTVEMFMRTMRAPKGKTTAPSAEANRGPTRDAIRDAERKMDPAKYAWGLPKSELHARAYNPNPVPMPEFAAPREDEPSETSPKFDAAVRIYTDALSRGETMTQTALASAIGQKSRKIAREAIAHVEAGES